MHVTFLKYEVGDDYGYCNTTKLEKGIWSEEIPFVNFTLFKKEKENTKRKKEIPVSAVLLQVWPCTLFVI